MSVNNHILVLQLKYSVVAMCAASTTINTDMSLNVDFLLNSILMLTRVFLHYRKAGIYINLDRNSMLNI